jgi:hypothetical protein
MPGRTASRGYTGQHTRIRAQLAPTVAAGHAHCTEPICLMRSRWIAPGSAWDLAHNRAAGGYHGPAHTKCNRSEGATWGNRTRTTPPVRRQGTSHAIRTAG